VSVRDWVAERSATAPPALRNRMVELLLPSENSDRSAAELCLHAAKDALRSLVQEQRFGRDSALDLLAIDGLATLAFEHASAVAASSDDLEMFARAWTFALGNTVDARG